MHFGIHIEGGVLIDLRTVPMMIAALVSGWVSTFVAAIIIIISRLLLYPVSLSSLVNVVVLTLSAAVFSFISYSSMKRERKWLLMTLSCVLILGSSLHFVIPDFTRGLLVFVQYAFAIAAAAAAAYLLTSYLWRSHANYEKLKEFAEKDFLTGLNNVRAFDEAINTAYSKAMQQDELSLLIIDIDHFKLINDTYGHSAGDHILKQLGQILLQSSRSVDIVSRNGGEEFSIIMPACDAVSARTLARRICQTVEQNVFVISDNLELKITASIGYATANAKSHISVVQLIHQADEGLYIAKRSGRNCVGDALDFEMCRV